MRAIKALFHLASNILCFANKHRDTLFYSAVALVTAKEFYQFGAITHNELAFLLFGPFIREQLRSHAWKSYLPKAKDGPYNKKARKAQQKYAQIADSVSLIYAGFTLCRETIHNNLRIYLIQEYPIITSTILLSGAVLASYTFHKAWQTLRNDNINAGDIHAAYFSPKIGMWNWPKRHQGMRIA